MGWKRRSSSIMFCVLVASAACSGSAGKVGGGGGGLFGSDGGPCGARIDLSLVAAQVGTAYFLAKPSSLDGLLAVIGKALDETPRR